MTAAIPLNDHLALAIIGYITACPGSTGSEIATALDKSHQSVVSKLRWMLQEDYLIARRSGDDEPERWYLTTVITHNESCA